MLKPLDKPDHIKIHFIIGSTRSGTGLLRHVLNNHYSCVCRGESKHLLLGYKKYGNLKEVTKELLLDTSKYKMPDGNNTLDSIFLLGEKLNYFEFCKRIYFAGTSKTDLSRINTIIDKNPFYTLKAEELIKLLPDAKFLCSVRDYRGFVLSNKESRELFANNYSAANYSILWMFYNKLILKLRKKYPEKVQMVYYEKFVSNKEETLRNVCSFLGIEFDENCFDYQKNIKEKIIKIKHNSRKLYKLNSLSNPINTSRVYAWKDLGVFTAMEYKIMDFWCGRIGEEFGYERNAKVNIIESAYIWVVSLPFYLKCLIYFNLKSVKLNFYLNDIRKSNYFKKVANSNA